jgi:hypothetical protein
MNDELPPEGRLTDGQRARMRSRLMAATDDRPRRSRPWLVPVAAAAAVGVLVATVTALGLSRGDEGGTPVAGQGGSGTPSVPPTTTSTVSVTATSTGAPSTDPAGGLPPIGPCVREAQAQLPNARDVDRIVYAGAATYLFSTGKQWIVCDSWAMRDGGPPTVLAPHAYGPEMGKDLFLISQNYVGDPRDPAQFFAAGARIPGVTAIRYTFPDGGSADATFTDAMWSMVYLTDWPKRVWTDPVHVAVTMQDGSTQGYDLTAMDLCAQANHGC